MFVRQLGRSLFPIISSVKSHASRRNVCHVTTAMPDLEERGRFPEKQRKWLTYNDKIFPPTRPGEEQRPAFVCHMKENVKYSFKKMWYVASFVRGMSIDEALKQLNFVNKKGALVVKETILEAQQLALKEHNVEFKSNLWIAESFCTKGQYVKGFKRHARGRMGKVEYKYIHYYVRLEEGKPPENYYQRPILNKETAINDWLQEMRNRNVRMSL